MRVKFISLKEPAKYGYIYDSEAWDTSSRFAICRHFQQCETYGDVHENGNYTQHSGEWVVQAEHLADYLASIATYIIRFPGEETDKLLCHFSGDIMRGPSTDAIEFAASVKFKAASEDAYYEAKPRWFSMEEKKLTTSRAKEYDKRYEKVESKHDGSVDAIYRMVIPSYANGLEFYSYADAIRNWCFDGMSDKGRPYFQGLTASFLKWFDGNAQKARELRYAFNACKALCEAYRQRCEADCMLHNLHWPPEVKAETTEASNAA